MTSGIIMLESHNTRISCFERQYNISQYFNDISFTIQVSLDNYKPFSEVRRNATPHHNTFGTPSVMLHDVFWMQTTTIRSPNSCPAIIRVQTKPTFVTEKNSAPISLTPVNTTTTPFQTSSFMPHFQNWSPKRSPTFQSGLLQDPSAGGS